MRRGGCRKSIPPSAWRQWSAEAPAATASWPCVMLDFQLAARCHARPGLRHGAIGARRRAADHRPASFALAGFRLRRATRPGGATRRTGRRCRASNRRSSGRTRARKAGFTSLRLYEHGDELAAGAYLLLGDAPAGERDIRRRSLEPARHWLLLADAAGYSAQLARRTWRTRLQDRRTTWSVSAGGRHRRVAPGSDRQRHAL